MLVRSPFSCAWSIIALVVGVAGMGAALAKNLPLWLVFWPLAVLLGIVFPYCLWVWVAREARGKGTHYIHNWTTGTLMVLALFYSGWTIFGAEKVPCRFSVQTNPTNLESTRICGYAAALSAREAAGDQERIAFLVLQSRDGDYFYVYLPPESYGHPLSNEVDSLFLGKWVMVTGQINEVQYRDEDMRSVELGNAMNFAQYGRPAKPGTWMKYIYPATIMEVPAEKK